MFSEKCNLLFSVVRPLDREKRLGLAPTISNSPPNETIPPETSLTLFNLVLTRSCGSSTLVVFRCSLVK